MDKLKQKTLHIPPEICGEIEKICEKKQRSFNFIAVELMQKALRKTVKK